MADGIVSYAGLSDPRLEGEYLFAYVSRRAREHAGELLDLGVGDVTLPLPRVMAGALVAAAREMGSVRGFRGYPPCGGYDFLRRAVARHYLDGGVDIDPQEVYISDGAKRELADLPRLLGHTCAYIPDPTYPAYRDVNIALGNEIHTMPCGEDGSLPMPRVEYGCGIYYICSPSNPTGAVYDTAALAAWVVHVRRVRGLIIFDAAYADYIPPEDTAHPRTIYAIEGARECAVEVASFSKSAGFTGLRCGHTVIPREIRVGRGGRADGISKAAESVSLARLYERYRSVSSNGVAYPVQRAAEAALTKAGRAAVRGCVEYYLKNAARLARALDDAGIAHAPAGASPYVWGQCPAGYDSRGFFDYLLDEAGILSTPGAGFGDGGAGHFRLSAFAPRRVIDAAAEKLVGLSF